jgi:hypothetical protein
MAPSTDPIVLSVPNWLVPHTEPSIEEMVVMLGDETVRLYRRFLAEEVRSQRPEALLPPCLRAFDRATCEVQRTSRDHQRCGTQ